MKWIEIKSKNDLPKEGEKVLVYSKYWGYCTAMVSIGITEKERKQLRKNEKRKIILDKDGTYVYEDFSSPRWAEYYGCDEQGNNEVPWSWRMSGPCSDFGQNVTKWCKIEK